MENRPDRRGIAGGALTPLPCLWDRNRPENAFPRPRLACREPPMNDPGEKLAGWTVEDHLVFDIGFALPRGPVRDLRQSLTEDERRSVAKAIAEHL